MATPRKARTTQSSTRTGESVSRRGSGRPKRETAVPSGSALPQGNPPEPTGTPAASARLVREVRSGLGVTREFFARMTGFSVRAISGWESGRPLSEAALRRVKEMHRLRDALAAGMRPEFIPQWLDTPCEGLAGLKPVEVLERGETDRLWRTVLLIGSGMPT